MAKYALIDGTTIENIIEAEPDFKIEGKKLVLATENAYIGGKYESGSFVPKEPEPEKIPTRVSSRQFKMQLHYAGLLNAVDTWIAAQSKPIQLAYENSGTFVRDDALMEQGFAALGYTTKQIDDFFLAASKL